MSLWTEEEIQLALNLNKRPNFASECTGVSIDTRTLLPGNIFIGIKGDNFDGNDYGLEALRKGACLVILESDDSISNYVVYVKRSKDALGKMAKFARFRMTNTKIVAITGSAGKTTTKELLAKILKMNRNDVYYSIKSYNNFIGVCLTIINMPKYCNVGIFEVGTNHMGEIAELSEILMPHISIITSILPVHMEYFRVLTNIIQEKYSLFDFTSTLCILDIHDYVYMCPELRAINFVESVNTHGKQKFIEKYQTSINYEEKLNIYEKIAQEIRNKFATFAKNLLIINYNCRSYEIINFVSRHCENCNISVLNVYQNFSELTWEFYSSIVQWKNNSFNKNAYDIDFKIFMQNKVHAALMFCLINDEKMELSQSINLQEAFFSQDSFEEISGRGKAFTFQENVKIIDESYNANPMSVIESIKNAYVNHDKNKLICVLGDMSEIGDRSAYYHSLVLDFALLLSNDVLAFGERMKIASENVILPANLKFFDNCDDIVEVLSKETNCSVLVKGSRRMNMDKIINRFRSL
ncbi:UDP-N-acetylmuramoyl-tripeptide--D-alanyl-D-alanine ligase [Candidatus Gromoviella agglomerans]|uniref:UDP-N-acetylmuramoyl-tripeptide--D-alanyl-D- alanine ligase n=1 Tax=Candidatus Gromoviella agglomerans TaxID=2806609 RepID=UPI001E4A4390|nr:UDP-N-acetylmuramoyl-tripeptide--D-alanyl-D-alanine ligase [Candidatus Gromoviella agglomerans]UFX98224.1 UDP-N-acetylmuramoyl-tripeptide--D-alanyl-D-alanine ligase [Candidatus Gromoviella agglomerans]